MCFLTEFHECTGQLSHNDSKFQLNVPDSMRRRISEGNKRTRQTFICSSSRALFSISVRVFFSFAEISSI